MRTKRTWLVTGCSSGFGRELAQELIERGDQVVVTARQIDSISELAALSQDQVLAIRLDVTKADTINIAVQAAIDRFGGIDVLVNNAGYMLVGSVEEVSEDEYRALFETNFFGFLNVTRAVLPKMRQQRSGRIVNISSMGGILGGAGTGHYCAAKFAMAAISESLAEEVAPFGIRITVIEPGGHRTNAIGGARFSPVAMDDYSDTVGLLRQRLTAVAGQEQGDPRLAAQAIIAVVDADEPPLHLPLGPDALARLNRKFELLAHDRDSWRELVNSTQFPQQSDEARTP